MINKILNDRVAEKIAEVIVGYIKENDKPNRDKKWYEYIKIVDPIEKDFIKLLQKLFKEMKEEVLSNMKKKPKAKVEDIDLWMFGKKTWTKRFEDEGGDMIKTAVILNGQRTMEGLPQIGISFDVFNPKVVELLKKRKKKSKKSFRKLANLSGKSSKNC